MLSECNDICVLVVLETCQTNKMYMKKYDKHCKCPSERSYTLGKSWRNNTCHLLLVSNIFKIKRSKKIFWVIHSLFVTIKHLLKRQQSGTKKKKKSALSFLLKTLIHVILFSAIYVPISVSDKGEYILLTFLHYLHFNLKTVSPGMEHKIAFHLWFNALELCLHFLIRNCQTDCI